MKRFLYLAVGFGFVALAIIGIVLPVLPTTPFLLVAAACFAKSSTRCHKWLINNKLFGPIIHNWQKNRCIPKKAKSIAVLSIVIFGSFSVFLAVPNIYGKLATSILLAIGLYVVLSIKTCPNLKK
ncbi:YbaN family protein [Thalassotalea nanhaiensis]|uniref:Inner membrane protein n=1 Tax=Thalassotalea nanhaiensis TaxID=3065648 RepID=A0ABY9TK56_9GAMM|nr:YbaN family protein [Colwelliaceae bacterium SQ345]